MKQSLAGELYRHLPEYAIEACALAGFMLSAVTFATLLGHPASPVRIGEPALRRMVMGLAMGATATAIIYSRPGRRSGAHMNPAVTLTFARLGKLAPVDAAAYVVAQFTGATVAMLALAAVAAMWVEDPSVNYVRTRPGPAGPGAAFAAELAISFGMMLMVLVTSNAARWRARTGLLAGLLVASFIALEDPLSGMSMNPARSFGPAVAAGAFDSLWVYFVAPPLGMLAAAEAFVRARGVQAVACAKLHHDTVSRCIFRCGFERLLASESVRSHSVTAAAVSETDSSLTIRRRPSKEQV